MSCFRMLTLTVALALGVLAGLSPSVAAAIDGLARSSEFAASGPRLAARAEPARPPDPVEEDPAVPYTVEKARGECWMKLENDRKAPRELEKRALLVNKCAEEKMKERAAH